MSLGCPRGPLLWFPMPQHPRECDTFMLSVAVTVFLFLHFLFRFPLYLARSVWLRMPLLPRT